VVNGGEKNRRRSIGRVAWPKQFKQVRLAAQWGSDDQQNKKGRNLFFPFYIFLFPPEESQSSLTGWSYLPFI